MEVTMTTFWKWAALAMLMIVACVYMTTNGALAIEHAVLVATAAAPPIDTDLARLVRTQFEDVKAQYEKIGARVLDLEQRAGRRVGTHDHSSLTSFASAVVSHPDFARFGDLASKRGK